MKINWKKISDKKMIVIALNIAMIALMAIVITVSASYTVLVGDDFTNGVRIGAFHVSFFEYLRASFDYVKSMYMDWQGPYFAMFVQAFLSPLNNFGLVQLKIVMIFNALFFMGSLFFVIWAALDYVLCGQDRKLHVRLTLFSIVLFSILDAGIFSEIFFWYCGATAYCMPLSVLQVSAGLFLMSNKTSLSNRKKNALTVASAVTLFMAAGGSLAITGTGCYLILLMTVGFYLVSQKISVRNIVITLSGIVGALINVAAPGNYARHSESAGEGFLLFKAVKWTLKNVCMETERLSRETLFGVMMVAMILAGVYLSDRVGRALTAYGIVSILALLTGFVTAFPVAYGYGGPYFPNRCYFILDVALVVTILNFAVFIGCCLDRWSGLRENKSAIAVLSIVLFAMVILGKETMESSALLAVAKSMNNGSYRDYYEQCTTVYDYLENCPEDDVIIDMPEYIENFECFYLDEDENGWVNVGVAMYYHKNSVKRKPE
ncbi:MAG: hypothetical protein K2L82_00845 [Lachnospiraceae bacterium]|nr:hypothetical protein [Lachnospiraceae bacterium]